MSMTGRHAHAIVTVGGVRQLARHLAETLHSVAAMDRWENIKDLVDDHCGFESHGQLLVAVTDARMIHAVADLISTSVKRRHTRINSMRFTGAVDPTTTERCACPRNPGAPPSSRSRPPRATAPNRGTLPR
jgi:hypothetical protein